MAPKAAISNDKLNLVKSLYLENKLCVREVAEKMGVCTDAVLYFIRKHNIPKRSFSEAQRILFERKKPSFIRRNIKSHKLEKIALIGSMLYWAEGFKRSKCTVDFANSDPKMIEMYLLFLRSVYKLSRKFSVALYCYSDQDVSKLINFWSNLTKIPKSQFIKPYVRSDFRPDARKMKHGLVHIRYNDKKLLLDILNMIEFFVDKYTSVGARVVKGDGL